MSDFGARLTMRRKTVRSRGSPSILSGEDNKRIVHIMFGYGSGNAVQISRSHTQRALSPDYQTSYATSKEWQPTKPSLKRLNTRLILTR